MESPCTKDEAARLVKALASHPCMMNVLPNGLTGNYTVEDCKHLGFKLAIYPCTGFSLSSSFVISEMLKTDRMALVPAAIAMEKSYAALRDQGTDLDHCGDWQIKDFFEVRLLFLRANSATHLADAEGRPGSLVELRSRGRGEDEVRHQPEEIRGYAGARSRVRLLELRLFGQFWALGFGR